MSPSGMCSFTALEMSAPDEGKLEDLNTGEPVQLEIPAESRAEDRVRFDGAIPHATPTPELRSARRGRCWHPAPKPIRASARGTTTKSGHRSRTRLRRAIRLEVILNIGVGRYHLTILIEAAKAAVAKKANHPSPDQVVTGFAP